MIKSSKIALHPATYDNGGMACGECMAFGLPAVGFNLESHKYYYKKGMIKVNDIEHFAETICMLLDDEVVYESLAKEAYEYIRDEWSWDTKSEEIWKECLFLAGRDS